MKRKIYTISTLITQLMSFHPTPPATAAVAAINITIIEHHKNNIDNS
jgi:hypothetical protein